MVNCSVIGCKNRTQRKCENITFHTFPKDKTSRSLWIAVTGRQNCQPTQHTRMCSVHFQAGCFQKKQQKMYLANYSIPTLAVHDVPVHCDKASSSETTEVLPMECDIQASNNLADTMTPRKLKLTMNLQRRTLIAENRNKKIAALRSKTRRLVKKMQN